MPSITFTNGWNLIGIGNHASRLLDPNEIIISDLYYYDNSNKIYKNSSYIEVDSVREYSLQKNVGYWCKIRADATTSQLTLMYTYFVASQATVNNIPLFILKIDNIDDYTKERIDTFIEQVEQSVTIMDTLFQPIQSGIDTHVIRTSLQSNFVLDGSLGQAGGGIIQINDSNTGLYGLGYTPGTNGLQILSQNVAVIIHEIMHVLGFGLGTRWNNLTDDSSAPNYFYTGKKGVTNYNTLVSNLYSSDPNLNNLPVYTKIPIEDDGGAGTAGAHVEEDETRVEVVDSGPDIKYPCFKRELMSGYLNGNNYITIITLGIFEDLGYSVNYDSDYVSVPLEIIPPNISSLLS